MTPCHACGGEGAISWAVPTTPCGACQGSGVAPTPAAEDAIGGPSGPPGVEVVADAEKGPSGPAGEAGWREAAEAAHRRRQNMLAWLAPILMWGAKTSLQRGKQR